MRVATFNLKHGAQPDTYRGNPEKVVAACKELREEHGADIIALQEVDKRVIRSGWADLAALAAKATGMEYKFARTMWFRGGQYGNALLVNGSISDVEIENLNGGRRFRYLPDSRNAILATVNVGETEYSVAATHLSTERTVAREQLSQVVGKLALRPLPQILMGDMNLGRYDTLSSLPRDMEITDGPPTFPANHPHRKIDHIAVQGLSIQKVDAVRLPVSDHWALVAEIE